MACVMYRYKNGLPPQNEYFFGQMKNIWRVLAAVYIIFIVPTPFVLWMIQRDPEDMRKQLQSEVYYYYQGLPICPVQPCPPA